MSTSSNLLLVSLDDALNTQSEIGVAPMGDLAFSRLEYGRIGIMKGRNPRENIT